MHADPSFPSRDPAIAVPWAQLPGRTHREEPYAPDLDTPIRVTVGPRDVGTCELCKGLGFVLVGVGDEHARALCTCTVVELGEPVGTVVGNDVGEPVDLHELPEVPVQISVESEADGKHHVVFRGEAFCYSLDAATALGVGLAFAEASARVDGLNRDDHMARYAAITAELDAQRAAG